jgi:hypothetical protein
VRGRKKFDPTAASTQYSCRDRIHSDQGGRNDKTLREQPIASEPAARAQPQHELTGDEVCTIVDQEIRRLPQNQQVAVVLCLLEGFTHEAAANQLGWPLGTVKSRIATARQTLTRRLTRRGLTPSCIIAILRRGLSLREPSPSVSVHLVRLATETAANSLASPSLVTATMSAPIARLAREVPKLMLITRIQAAAVLVTTITALAWIAPTVLSARPVNPVARTRPEINPSTNPSVPPFQPPRTDL